MQNKYQQTKKVLNLNELAEMFPEVQFGEDDDDGNHQDN